jgi:hypothetical protein
MVFGEVPDRLERKHSLGNQLRRQRVTPPGTAAASDQSLSETF